MGQQADAAMKAPQARAEVGNNEVSDRHLRVAVSEGIFMSRCSRALICSGELLQQIFASQSCFKSVAERLWRQQRVTGRRCHWFFGKSAGRKKLVSFQFFQGLSLEDTKPSFMLCSLNATVAAVYGVWRLSMCRFGSGGVAALIRRGMLPVEMTVTTGFWQTDSEGISMGEFVPVLSNFSSG